jgi:hypothetical protein
MLKSSPLCFQAAFYYFQILILSILIFPIRFYFVQFPQAECFDIDTNH